jgi:hypothetical protein
MRKFMLVIICICLANILGCVTDTITIYTGDLDGAYVQYTYNTDYSYPEKSNYVMRIDIQNDDYKQTAIYVCDRFHEIKSMYLSKESKKEKETFALDFKVESNTVSSTDPGQSAFLAAASKQYHAWRNKILCQADSVMDMLPVKDKVEKE